MSAKPQSGGKSSDSKFEGVPPGPTDLAGANGHAEGAPQELPMDEEGVLLQQVMRFRNPDGSETIYATLRAEFAPGERGTTLYVGFCPPFPHLPVVEAEAMEGPAVRVTVVQVQNNGAQIDVELEHPLSDPAQVTIEVAALPASGE